MGSLMISLWLGCSLPGSVPVPPACSGAPNCSPLSAGALISARAACTQEMSIQLMAAGPTARRCTLRELSHQQAH